PGTETTPATPGAESTPVAPVAPESSAPAVESSPVAPGVETTPVAPVAPSTTAKTSALVSTTEGTIPTTLESVPAIQPSANSSYTIASVSSFEGAGNNMRLTYGAAIIGLAAFLI
ncbi:hypothetical protein MG7_03574, partial [Candida albicans P34048]